MSAPTSPRRSWLLAALTAGVAVVLSCGGAEILLRAMGRGPLVFQGERLGANYFRQHPRRGWVHKPGTFRVGGAKATFLEDRSRAAGDPRMDAPDRALVLVGGSFTEGHGVPDADTFAWHLQERYPDLRVLNHGTGGYGTLQALYAADEVLGQLRRGGVAVDAVVYGYMWHHGVRNVADYRWRRMLGRQSRGEPGNPVRIPYALLEDGKEVRHYLPEPWPGLWLSSRSALANFAVEQWVERTTEDRSAQAGPVTLALLDEMDRLARDAGTRLLVALLYTTPVDERRVATHLGREGIAYASCIPENYKDPRYRDPRTSHPTALAHEGFAACIGRSLDALADRR